MFRAVLFDVGGPLNTEVEHEAQRDRAIRSAFAAEGRAVDDAAYARACRRAVESFGWNAYAAIIWRLARHDLALSERVFRRFRAATRGPTHFQMREGMPELLDRLRARGLLLGLAANQPPEAVAQLDELGVGRYFSHRQVSGSHGFRKPDVRLFLRACDDLGVAPAECIMVGDRIDNDVVPAKLLGMRTILFRTGRHRAQQPRAWDERPDAVVDSVPDLEAAILRLVRDAVPI
jgi:putative hydrolase of the HAD superfamily